jgi:hypothetical protein
MRIATLVLITLCWAIFYRPAFAAECPEGSNWTSTWTDSFGQTTYTLQAPCKVYLGIPFTITANVTDPSYPNTSVGWNWAITDNGSILASNSSPVFGIRLDGTGFWQTSVQQTYTGTAIDHALVFSFTDYGKGSSFMSAAGSSVGGLTVDPYLITLDPDFTFSANQQSTTTIPATVYVVSGGNPLSFRWLEGSTVLQAYQPVVGSGYASVPLNLAVLPTFSAGIHTFTLEVTDGTVTGSKSTAVTVTAPSSPSVAVPVMDGWWLLPGILAGLGILAKRWRS